MAFGARAIAFAALLGIPAVAPAVALAQSPSAAPAQQPPPPPAATPPAAPSSNAKPAAPATGYGWTPHKQRVRSQPRDARALHKKDDRPDAILPGFETMADGTSRLFVELSRPVPFDTKVARGSVTYVLKGAHVDKRNNYNPLVTVHFNTPAASARLVPHGKDLWFVVELRANVTPAATMNPGKDGTAILRIEFPKGDWLPKGASPAAPAPSDAPASVPHAPKPGS